MGVPIIALVLIYHRRVFWNFGHSCAFTLSFYDEKFIHCHLKDVIALLRICKCLAASRLMLQPIWIEFLSSTSFDYIWRVCMSCRGAVSQNNCTSFRGSNTSLFRIIFGIDSVEIESIFEQLDGSLSSCDIRLDRNIQSGQPSSEHTFSQLHTVELYSIPNGLYLVT